MTKITRYMIDDRGTPRAYTHGHFIRFAAYDAEVERIHKAYRALLDHYAQCAARDIGGVWCSDCEALETAVGITDARDLRASIDNMQKKKKP